MAQQAALQVMESWIWGAFREAIIWLYLFNLLSYLFRSCDPFLVHFLKVIHKEQ